jgi:hypothetical protein
VFEGSFRAAEQQRVRITTLEEVIKPKIKLSFDPNGYGIQQTPVHVIHHVPASPPTSFNSITGMGISAYDFATEHAATYVRIQVEAISYTTVVGCL